MGIVQEYQQGQKVRMLPTEAATTVTHCWPYVKWDESSNKLVPDSSEDPLSTKVLERCLLTLARPPDGDLLSLPLLSKAYCSNEWLCRGLQFSVLLASRPGCA